MSFLRCNSDWFLGPFSINISAKFIHYICSQIVKFMGPTWGPPGSCRPQMGPILAPWTLLLRLLLPPLAETLLYIKPCFLYGVPILFPYSIGCGEAPGTGFDLKGTSQIVSGPRTITWPTGISSATLNLDPWHSPKICTQFCNVNIVANIYSGGVCQQLKN